MEVVKIFYWILVKSRILHKTPVPGINQFYTS